MLNYGAFDQEHRPSHQHYDGSNYMLTAEEMAGFWAQYLAGHLGNTRDSRPLHADLTGLPPTHLCIAECDILADENRELATRLKAATVQIEARLSFDEALTDLSLAAIVEAMEHQRGSDWRLEALGPRYEILRRQVIGFRAEITGLHARFKLGQDESDVVFDHILSHSTNPDLAQWMRRMRNR